VRGRMFFLGGRRHRKEEEKKSIGTLLLVCLCLVDRAQKESRERKKEFGTFPFLTLSVSAEGKGKKF